MVNIRSKKVDGYLLILFKIFFRKILLQGHDCEYLLQDTGVEIKKNLKFNKELSTSFKSKYENLILK